MPFSSSFISALRRYAQLVEQWNRKLNLTGAKSEEEFLQKQVLDCLQAHYSVPSAQVWLDIGSGAGLPGIVWAIARPNELFILVESLHKRASFLQRVCSDLKLANVLIFPGRFEAFNMAEWEKLLSYKLWSAKASLRNSQAEISCVSRGTAAPEDLLALAAASEIPWRSWLVFSSVSSHEHFHRQGAVFNMEIAQLNYESRLAPESAPDYQEINNDFYKAFNIKSNKVIEKTENKLLTVIQRLDKP